MKMKLSGQQGFNKKIKYYPETEITFLQTTYANAVTKNLVKGENNDADFQSIICFLSGYRFWSIHEGLPNHCTGSFQDGSVTSSQEHIKLIPTDRATPRGEELRTDWTVSAQQTGERAYRTRKESHRHYTVGTPPNTLPCSPEGSWKVPHRLLKDT